MSLLLLLYHLCAGTAAAAAPLTANDSDLEPFFDSGGGRSTWDIVKSCLITILACTWVSIHRNVPEPGSPGTAILDRIQISAVALLAPEWILAWAICQYASARRLSYKLQAIPRGGWKPVSLGGKDLQSDSEDYGYDQCTCDDIRSVDVADVVLHENNQFRQSTGTLATDAMNLTRSWVVPASSYPTMQDWTLKHCFFVIMGGFYLYDGNKPCHALSDTDMITLAGRGFIPPDGAAIQDKSKADGISKGLALMQTMWFVVQCLSRPIHHLPITELEVVTLAYTTVNVVMYGVWWLKLLNVDVPMAVHDVGIPRRYCPSRIPDAGRPPPQLLNLLDWRAWYNYLTSFGFLQGGTPIKLHGVKKVPLFYSGDRADRLNMRRADRFMSVKWALSSSALSSFLFGAIHCAAWNGHSSTYTEKMLWRMFSVAITALPMVPLMIPLLLFRFPGRDPYPISGWEKIWRVETVIIVERTRRFASVLYIVSRIVLLVLAFASLRAVPQAALDTVSWIDYIPHV